MDVAQPDFAQNKYPDRQLWCSGGQVSRSAKQAICFCDQRFNGFLAGNPAGQFLRISRQICFNFANSCIAGSRYIAG